MANSRRVVFTFDQRSLDSLERLRKQGNYSSMADAVRDSLRLRRAQQQQAEQGFVELVVRNPKTGDERILVNPEAESTEQ